MSRVATAPAALALAALALAAGGTSAAHPLDPLSEMEIRAAIAAVRRADGAGADARFPWVSLEQPDKAVVLAWKPGAPIPRRARVTVLRGAAVAEAVVDVRRAEVVSWTGIDGVHAPVLPEESRIAREVVTGHAAWTAAVRERGIESVDDVVTIPLTAGDGSPADDDRRLVEVVAFDGRGVTNFWGRPLEGLVATVDLVERAVVGLTDAGGAPVPAAPVDFDPGSVGEMRTPPRPIGMVQPSGPGFRQVGHEIEWQNWRFHLRVDSRVGPVVSTVRYRDGERWRSVLYQGYLSELFVPYMSPDAGWQFRAFLDAGEYGIGKYASPLIPGSDCPSGAVFVDATFADELGEPYTLERAACVFERYAGDVLWRHWERVHGTGESRRSVELVLRTIPAVGNYDYVLDWTFRQDGSIRVSVGATGVEQVRAVAPATAAGDGDGRADAHGRMVAAHTLAVHHDHFFSFRLDLDVDGPVNSLQIDRLRTVTLDEGPRRSLWALDPRVAETEHEGRLRIDLQRPALWRVVAEDVRGPMGYPVGYQVKPGFNALPLLTADDPVQRRAGFTDHHLWVTPYRRDERHAAGDYPNRSRGGAGLPAWTAADRPVRGTDIVVWYTLGFHHVVRAEDWPVLPTGRHAFELRPFDFFARNPALDVPR